MNTEAIASMRTGMLLVHEQIPAKNVIYRGEILTDVGRIPVVWKPGDGERDPRPGIKGRHYVREAAVYAVSLIFNEMINVPETVVLTHNGQEGSAQRWLADAIIGDWINLDYMIFMRLNQWRWAAAFDYLTGNNDRHSGNWMVDAKGTLWLIDNGSSFPEENDCWRGSLAILRPMINRGIEIPRTFKAKLSSFGSVVENLLRDFDLHESIEPLRERSKLLLAASDFSELVIRR